MAIGDFCPGRVLETAYLLISKLGIPDKKSGYIAVMLRENGRLILHAQVGDCPDEKANKYRELSLEKAQRVYDYRTISSWITRDPQEDKYGGGIAAGKYIIAFSGLPEEADEALVVALAEQLELLTSADAKNIIAVSKNSYIEKLRS
jgi:hypothetical protein